MQKRSALMVGMVVVVLAIGGMAVGCLHHGSPEKKIDHIVAYLTDDMALTGEQGELLDKFKKDLVFQLKSVRSARERAHDVVITELKKEVMDSEKVLSAIQDVRAEVDDIITLAVSRLAEFHRTLTPEQKAQLIEQLEDLRKLHGCE